MNGNRVRSQTEVRLRGRDPFLSPSSSHVSSISPAAANHRPRSASIVNSPSPAVNSSSGSHTHTELSAEAAATLQRRSTEITRFRVFSRVRPFIDEELLELQGAPLRSVVEMSGSRTILLDPKDEWVAKAQFEFDASLWSIPPSQKLQHTFQDAVHEQHETQLAVYNLVAKPSVSSAFEGFNSCILTYGQTGSGKTYTMMGKYNPTLVCGGDGEEGIIPRVCNDIFQILENKRAAELTKPETERIAYRVEVNFVEIYLERVRDLLDPQLKNSKDAKMNEAKIRQDPNSGPFVEGVTKYQVENWQHCCMLLERGSQHRTTCATLVHQQSSRSHAIFQITVLEEETVPAKDRYSRPTTRTRAGRLNLVDLAGSERGGMTDYVKESAAINTSLLALRRVIDNLVERQNILLDQARQQISGMLVNDRQALPQVPFRDSVLTWLLSDSIGGNARTTMVATLSPLAKNYGDTLATLQWSSKARNLVTLVKMNDVQTVVTDGMNSKASELNQAVVIQRQNVDSLKDALQAKQDYADSLEKETKTVMRQIIQEKVLMEEVRRNNAALVMQREMKSFLSKKRRAALVARISQVDELLLQQKEALAARELERADAQQAVEENETLLMEAINNEDEARSTVETIDDTQVELDKRMAEIRERYEMISGDMGKDEAACRQQISQLQDQQARLVQEIETIRNDTTKTNAHIELMTNAAKKLSDASWKSTVAAASSELSALQSEVEQLKRKKMEASAKRDVLRAQKNKLYSKK